MSIFDNFNIGFNNRQPNNRQVVQYQPQPNNFTGFNSQFNMSNIGQDSQSPVLNWQALQAQLGMQNPQNPNINNNNNWLTDAFGGGQNNGMGWANGAIGAVGGIANMYLGLKGLKLSQDQFNYNKGLNLTNLANTAKMTNASLEDRQRRRASSRGLDAASIEQSVKNYLKKNKVRGSI